MKTVYLHTSIDPRVLSTHTHQRLNQIPICEIQLKNINISPRTPGVISTSYLIYKTGEAKTQCPPFIFLSLSLSSLISLAVKRVDVSIISPISPLGASKTARCVNRRISYFLPTLVSPLSYATPLLLREKLILVRNDGPWRVSARQKSSLPLTRLK